MWRSLRERGVPEIYVRIIKESYRNATAKLKKAPWGQQDTIQLDMVNTKRVKRFKYLGAMTEPSGGMGKEINHRIQHGWNWRKETEVEEKKLDVTEMKMLRWMSGVTRFRRMRNEFMRGLVKVVEILKNRQETKMRWFGDLMKRNDEEHIGREAMDMEITEKGKTKNQMERLCKCRHERERSRSMRCSEHNYLVTS
ncbi:uncharacterized protein LOC134776005 [Penaeus indicus]|uniref:uncharacterized protein LOC134776005 n=1 Tax=Penaeus indicus TaxID=29960 RepID=UPI00300CAF1D